MSNHPLFVCVPKVKKFLKKVSEPKLSIPNVNTERFNIILHGGGGGAQSARANFKDSYLRNEYCYSNEIW